jgi:16S rRNA (cytosine967-C5)-methyltransferase
MRPGARLQAAIDILGEVLGRGRAASVALADWGRAHRFAGSADRGSIGNLVFDCLRRKNSLAWRMGSEEPRALALGALRLLWSEKGDALAAMCAEPHGPSPLSEAESAALLSPRPLADAPPWVRGDYPEWLDPAFADVFGEGRADEGAALARRAPIDLRANMLKANRDKLLRAFADDKAEATPFSPWGVRLPPREGPARAPNVEASAAHGKGWFEVQDEGSQLAVLLCGAEPRMQVLDLCAGAGGKTLALAAQMRNTGQIFAYDADAHRFRPIFERLKRAGARNVQTLEPAKPEALAALGERMDLVLIDAPCSGSGVWRRKPDAKWRLTAQQVEARCQTQRDILSSAIPLLKPGGMIGYVTCSLLDEENHAQIRRFLQDNEGFTEFMAAEAVQKAGLSLPPTAASGGPGLLLSPKNHDTDGFYVALLCKRAM